MNTIKSFARSFRWAFHGVAYALSTQRNMRFHFAAAIAAVVFSLVLGIGPLESLWVLLAIVMTIAAELWNTATEKLVDLSMPKRHPLAKAAKDTAAAAVLAAAVFAVAVCIIVFGSVLLDRIMDDAYMSGTIASQAALLGVLVLLIGAVIYVRFAQAYQTGYTRKQQEGEYKMNAGEGRAEELLQHAREAGKRAYAPYSNFWVGAALLDQHGHIHYGCNVENSAYGPTNCAERTALFRAIADGVKAGHFQAIAVMGDTEEPITPCGTCRQVMAELCPPDMPVILGNASGKQRLTTVSDLLPGAFRLTKEEQL